MEIFLRKIILRKLTSRSSLAKIYSAGKVYLRVNHHLIKIKCVFLTGPGMTEWWLIAIALCSVIGSETYKFKLYTQEMHMRAKLLKSTWMMKDANRTFRVQLVLQLGIFCKKNKYSHCLSHSVVIDRLKLENTCKSILVFSYDFTRPKFNFFVSCLC